MKRGRKDRTLGVRATAVKALEQRLKQIGAATKITKIKKHRGNLQNYFVLGGQLNSNK